MQFSLNLFGCDGKCSDSVLLLGDWGVGLGVESFDMSPVREGLFPFFRTLLHQAEIRFQHGIH